MPPRAVTGARGTRARGRGRGRGRGRPASRRVVDDDDEGGGDETGDAQDVADDREGVDEGADEDQDVVMRDPSDASDGSDYVSSADGDEEGDEEASDDDDDETDASEADSVESDAPRRKGKKPAATTKANKPRPARPTSQSQSQSADDDHRIIPTYAEAARIVRTSRGPYKRGDPPKHMMRAIYGRGMPLVQAMCERWTGVLPAADPAADSGGGGVLASPWLPEHFEDDQINALRQWYGSFTPRVSENWHPLQPEYLPYATTDDAAVYVLPAGSSDDAVRVLRPGACIGLPAEGDPAAIQQTVKALGGGGSSSASSTDSDSYLLHAGGEICALAWAPVGSPHLPQLLAIAAMPHKKGDAGADDNNNNYDEADRSAAALDPSLPLQLSEDPLEDAAAAGGVDGQPPSSPASLQLWSMSLSDEEEEKTVSDDASRQRPVLQSVVCFDWGWPKRMAWCPVPLVYDADELAGTAAAAADRVYGLLAVLTEDGIVRVIEVRVDGSASETTPTFVHAPAPLATLQIANEPGAAATCLAWVGLREMVLGHADGSITLWALGGGGLGGTSAAPARMLLRVPAHDDRVLDVCSAYPSHPYLVASRPVQGVARLVDLRRPAAEHTYHPTPSVSFQPQLLAWSDHLQGFAAAAATNNPVNGRLDLFPLTHFPLPLVLVPHTRASLPTCLSAGAVHPYLAMGRSDGSVCVVNMLEALTRSARKSKIKATLSHVLNSEWRGGGHNNNNNIGSLAVRTLNTLSYKGIPLGSLGLARHAAHTVGAAAAAAAAADGDTTLLEDDDVDGDADGDAEAGTGTGAADATAHPFRGPSLMRIHDALTRVAAVAWNPNLEYGTWCASGLASGVVSIKKLAPRNIV